MCFDIKQRPQKLNEIVKNEKKFELSTTTDTLSFKDLNFVQITQNAHRNTCSVMQNNTQTIKFKK